VSGLAFRGWCVGPGVSGQGLDPGRLGAMRATIAAAFASTGSAATAMTAWFRDKRGKRRTIFLPPPAAR